MEQDCDFLYPLFVPSLFCCNAHLAKGRSYVVSPMCTIIRSRCEVVSARAGREDSSGSQTLGLPC